MAALVPIEDEERSYGVVGRGALAANCALQINLENRRRGLELAHAEGKTDSQWAKLWASRAIGRETRECCTPTLRFLRGIPRIDEI